MGGCFCEVLSITEIRRPYVLRDTKRKVVCYTAIFSIVRQHWRGALCDNTKNGCVAD